MFRPERLQKLSPSHRLRKTALLLERLEEDYLAGRGEELGGGREFSEAAALARALVSLPETPSEVSAAAASLLEALDESGGASPAERGEAALRAMDALRHLLIKVGGQSRADWDLIDPDTGRAAASRRSLPGLKAYFEDIRSPFNVGSMLRTGEALGLEEAILSPGCADPDHPRALRSAMGAVELLPWRRGGLDILESEPAVFALELGGRALGDFEFPERGIVILGSEELGVSRAALARTTLGSVSIPLRGAKASLNVGVAFGILLQAWASRIDAQA